MGMGIWVEPAIHGYMKLFSIYSIELENAMNFNSIVTVRASSEIGPINNFM